MVRHVYTASALCAALFIIIWAAGCGSSDSVTGVDTKPPTNPRIVINDGDVVTYTQTVTLTLSCDDDTGVTMMRLSNAPNPEGNLWEAFSETREWTLSDNYGVKTVFVTFRDDSGNMSPFAKASITYAQEPD